MKKATLKQKNAAGITFDLPDHLGEVRLNQMIDFLVESRRLDEQDEAGAIVTMAKAVSAFFSIPISDIMNSYAGSYPSGFTDTVSNLFGYVATLISDYKPSLSNDTDFNYKGEVYKRPTIKPQVLHGEVLLPPLTTLEVIEVAEVNRWKTQSTKIAGDPDGQLRKRVFAIAGADEKLQKAAEIVYAGKLEEAGDPDGSLIYSYYLKTIAILCKKEGEQLPIEDSMREAWIQERAYHFQDIDAATALGVDFFLTNFSSRSGLKMGAAGFLKNQCFALLVAIRLRSAKPLKNPWRNPRKLFKKSVGDN